MPDGGRLCEGDFAGNPAGNARPRIVVADDHSEVLEAIQDLLAPEFDVTGVTGAAELLQAASELRPDLVISDIELGGPDGIDVGRLILEQQLSRRVLILTMHQDPHFVERALDSGICGFVLKIDAGEELIAAIRCVLEGRFYFSKTVRRR
jgi:DNA-binding NarL/FixJ family response regulator